MAKFSWNMMLVVAAVAWATSAMAQHHHRHHSHHHGSYYGHGNWNYVVPQYGHHHHGSYFVQGGAYYYTPSPVIRVVGGPQVAVMPPVPVVQKPVAIQYGEFARCDDLAGRLEMEANRLCLEMHYNCQHNPGYPGVYREAYTVLQAAKYVHNKEHQGYREAIRREVANIDQMFHHVQGEVTQWNRIPQRQIGNGGLIEKVSAVEALMHHLCYDVGVEPHGDGDEQAPPPSGDELAPPPAGTISSPPPPLNPQ